MRFDSKLDQTTDTFVILGLWLEGKVLGKDESFAEALAGGFARFIAFLDASRLDEKFTRELLPAIAQCIMRWTLQEK